MIDTPAITDDLLQTLLELAGVSPAPGRYLDGVSLALLFEGRAITSRALFWHFPQAAQLTSEYRMRSRRLRPVGRCAEDNDEEQG